MAHVGCIHQRTPATAVEPVQLSLLLDEGTDHVIVAHGNSSEYVKGRGGGMGVFVDLLGNDIGLVQKVIHHLSAAHRGRGMYSPLPKPTHPKALVWA